MREELHHNFETLIQDTSCEMGCAAIRIIRTLALSPEGAPMMIGLWQPHHTSEFLLQLSNSLPDPPPYHKPKKSETPSSPHHTSS